MCNYKQWLLQLHSNDVISTDVKYLTVKISENCIQELPNELWLLWMAYVELAYPRMESVQSSACRWFQDLEKLHNAQPTTWMF